MGPLGAQGPEVGAFSAAVEPGPRLPSDMKSAAAKASAAAMLSAAAAARTLLVV